MAEDFNENEDDWTPVRFREDEEMDFFTELALHEAERWIQAVTRKKFEYAEDFRKSLGNGVLLCELLNCLKPGSVKRINKLPGPIAGLDNLNVFLAACENSFGLNKTQLFDPNDLEDLSTRAIADEGEDFLKLETDRRARNVAVTVYWLGKSVAGKYKGAALDASAFSALVHSHGNKSIISDDCFKNGSPISRQNSIVTESNHKHIRDSSYDSLGSYERESESSFDELDSSGNLQGRADMREMRRYNSSGSLSMSRDLRLSTASGDDDKNDSMYVSSPDLSQGSHNHTRSSSTDSMEGPYYGNHSRQSSGSADSYATRRLSTNTRKTSSSTPDPLQFVKLKGAGDLAQQAKKQMEVAKEVNMMRGKVDSAATHDEPDWQSNFNNWKSRRKSAHSHVVDDMSNEEPEKRPHKTFGQIMAEKEKRKSLGNLTYTPFEDDFPKVDKKEKRRSMGPIPTYPMDDDDSGVGMKTRESPISKSSSQKNESKPKSMKSKSKDIAPWAEGSSGEENSQSDSETNNSHQSGDTDSVFSDKSTPSKVLSDDDSWVKNRPTPQTVSNKLAPHIKSQKSLGDNVKSWENNVSESQKRDDKNIRGLPANSAKIRNITQAYEQKDKDASASPTVTKRADYGRGSLSKSLDLSDHSFSKPYSPSEKKPMSPLSPTAPQALIPRDQRYSPGTSTGGSPAINNANRPCVSDNVRYFQSVLPSHVLNPSVLTPGITSTMPKNPPTTAPKPSRSKIAAVKAMFELTSETASQSASEIPNDKSASLNGSHFTGPSDSEKEYLVNSPDKMNDLVIKKGESDVDDAEKLGEMSTTKDNDIANDSEESKDEDMYRQEVDESVRNMEHCRDKLYDIPEISSEESSQFEPEKTTDEVSDGLERGGVNTEVVTSETTKNQHCLVDFEEAENLKGDTQNDIEEYAEQIVDCVLENVKNVELNSTKQEIPKLDLGFTDNIEVNNHKKVNSDLNDILKELDDACTMESFENTDSSEGNETGNKSSPSSSVRQTPGITNNSKSVLNSNSLDDIQSLDQEVSSLQMNSSPIHSELTNKTTQEMSKTENYPSLPVSSVLAQVETPRCLHEHLDSTKHSDQTIDSPRVMVQLLNSPRTSDHYLNSPRVSDEPVDSGRHSDQSEDTESPRPPALPTSSIPDIIVSNIVDHTVADGEKSDGIYAYPALEKETNNDDLHERFNEQTIKINQKPNNDRGFGFFLVGGSEKKQPVTVQRVSLGSEASDDVFIDDTKSSAADVCEVEANDELISINGRDVTTLTLAQVQGIVDHSVKRGQIELRIKRYLQEDGYDSMEDNAFTDKTSVNDQTDGHTNNTLENNRPMLQISTKVEDRPRLMDQLIEEHQRETNNNEKNQRAPSPVEVEQYQANITFNTQSKPSQQTIVVNQTARVSHDMSAPEEVTLTEERSTISVKRSPVSASQQQDHSPVMMRRTVAPVVQESPEPPTPPKTELPPLAKFAETPTVPNDDNNAGFGPPAALMRWQRPRARSEYVNPFPSLENKPSDRTKRFSATLPYKSDSPFSLDNDYSKDDSMLEKVSKDFIESVSVSKPVESKPEAYQFNDSSRIQDWQNKQDQERKPEPQQSTPPLEFNIHREEHLTAQSAAPTRKQAQTEAPNLMEINVPNYSEPPQLSQQEKFERDQQRIRMQYEEERKRAQEAEKQKQEQEKQTLDSDKFLRNMEAQILQTKQEAANHNLFNNEPIKSTDTTPRFNSEPMTIKLPSNSQGRQLVIDPRNQSEKSDNVLPEYSFRVDLSKNESAPPLRTLNQPELSQEEILAREREKIREEEKRKFEQEQQRWKEEKERELREEQESIKRERERLHQEQEKIEREKALLEQKARQEENLRSQPVNNRLYSIPRSSTGSTGSSVSPSARSPPAALDPKYREAQSKKAPPPTAPKPERGPTKARLTREDLLAMNRKATPLTRPDPSMEVAADKTENNLSPTTREAPSKGELHSLNAVPKPKFHSSAAWIKEKDIENNTQNEKPFVIGNRSDLIHQRDYSTPSDHWVVREAEKRRLAEKADRANISVTAHAGPAKPSESSLVSRFRTDVEPPARSNRYSYPSTYSSDLRPLQTNRPLSGTGPSSSRSRSPEQNFTQFSAKTQPNSYTSNPSLSQTLPTSFSFNANVRNHDGTPTKPPRSLTDDTGPVIAVSGKQKCSHCGEELGFGAAMVIESLGLYYHVQCFSCCVCRAPLGNGSEGTDVRVRVNKLHCKNCYSNDEAGLKFSKV